MQGGLALAPLTGPAYQPLCALPLNCPGKAEMACPVSRLFNNVKNDRPSLIEPTTPNPAPESLFGRRVTCQGLWLGAFQPQPVWGFVGRLGPLVGRQGIWQASSTAESGNREILQDGGRKVTF